MGALYCLGNSRPNENLWQEPPSDVPRSSRKQTLIFQVGSSNGTLGTLRAGDMHACSIYLGLQKPLSLNGCYSRFLQKFPAALSIPTNPRDPSGIDSLKEKERGRSMAFEAATAK